MLDRGQSLHGQWAGLSGLPIQSQVRSIVANAFYEVCFSD
jgi:hypothetical protein